MKRTIFLSTFFLFLFSIAGLSQSNVQKPSIDDGWRKIIPLKTDKNTVNKLFGKPKIDDNGYYGYDTADGLIWVNYSTSPCESNQYNRGQYNVKKGTILDYTLNLSKLTELSEINFKREKYQEDMSDHANFGSYINEEDGITINVIVMEKEYVRNIDFRPSKNNAEKFKCKD